MKKKKEYDEVVICTACNKQHKYSERINKELIEEDKNYRGMKVLLIKVCPKCQHESYTPRE